MTRALALNNARREASKDALGEVDATAKALNPTDPIAANSYKNSILRKTPGLTSGIDPATGAPISVGDASSIIQADAPYAAVDAQADSHGGARPGQSFNPTAEDAQRPGLADSFDATFSHGRNGGGLGSYLRSQTIGRLPFTDSGKQFVERDSQGKVTRVVHANDLDAEQLRTITDKQSKLRKARK